jgi:hypothetical protein
MGPCAPWLLMRRSRRAALIPNDPARSLMLGQQQPHLARTKNLVQVNKLLDAVQSRQQERAGCHPMSRPK